MHKYLKYIVAAFIGIALLTLPISVPTIKTFCDCSIFNTKWNGCSKFANMAYSSGGDVVPLLSPYNTYNFNNINGVLFIIAPNLDFSKYEIEKIKEFLDNGNTVVIADDFGTANEILRGLNLSMRISKHGVNDLFYHIDDDLTTTYKINTFGGNITTNIPSFIHANDGVILTSSVSTSNGKQKSFPIMVETNYSNGKIIIISDPDVFINGMHNFNSKFWEGFLEHINAKTYYFDEVHHAGFDPYDIGVVYLHSSVSKNTMFLVFFVVVTLGFLIETKMLNGVFERIIRIFRRKNKKLDENLLYKIAKEHNIDIESLRYFVETIREGRKYGRKRLS